MFHKCCNLVCNCLDAFFSFEIQSQHIFGSKSLLSLAHFKLNGPVRGHPCILSIQKLYITLLTLIDLMTTFDARGRCVLNPLQMCASKAIRGVPTCVLEIWWPLRSLKKKKIYVCKRFNILLSSRLET